MHKKRNVNNITKEKIIKTHLKEGNDVTKTNF